MYLMIRRLLVLVATMTVVAAVSGCAESTREAATGESSIRGINAIVTAPAVSFLIEERNLGNVDFKGNSGFNSFDDLSYNFSFDLLRPGIIEPDRLTTEFIDVVADIEYTVVLAGTIANPSSFFWEDPIQEWSGTETVFEIIFAHLAPSMGELDFYFAAPGTVPVLGQAVGALTNGARLAILEFEEAVYELILTPKDDPATIVYRSALLASVAQSRATIAVFDADPTVTGNVGVSFIAEAGGSSVLADVNFPPQMRTLHAAFGTENDFEHGGPYRNHCQPIQLFLGGPHSGMVRNGNCVRNHFRAPGAVNGRTGLLFRGARDRAGAGSGRWRADERRPPGDTGIRGGRVRTNPDAER